MKIYFISKSGYSIEYVNKMDSLLFLNLYETLKSIAKNGEH